MTENTSPDLPKYPEPESDTSAVRITREATFPAWAGKPDKLVALEREMARVLGEYYRDFVKDLSGDEALPAAEAAIKNLQLHASVSAADGRLRRTGTVSAILAEMDASEVETIWLKNRTEDLTQYPSIELRITGLAVNETFPAVQLKVTGNDRHWVGGVYDLLSGELRKAVPGWARMRSGWTAFLLTAVLLVGAEVAVIGIMRGNNAETRTIVSTCVMISLLSLLIVSFFMHSILLRLFPSLEILEPGGDSKSRQTRAFIFAAASFALGVAGVVLGVLAL